MNEPYSDAISVQLEYIYNTLSDVNDEFSELNENVCFE